MRTLELIPVVELEPFAFSERTWTTASTGDHWRACLADAGVVLPPIIEGSWHVRLADVLLSPSATPVLRRLLRNHEVEHLDDENALNGGYALFDQGALKIAPQCCCDLGNLADWEDAVAQASASWSMLWIGHPWTHVRRRGDLIELAPVREGDPGADDADFAVVAAELSEAIRAADRMRAECVDVLERVLAEVTPIRPLRAAAMKLVGIDDPRGG